MLSAIVVKNALDPEGRNEHHHFIARKGGKERIVDFAWCLGGVVDFLAKRGRGQWFVSNIDQSRAVVEFYLSECV